LGHAYSALYTWAAADRLGGVALLRIEDIDTERCKPEFVDAIFRDLHWLGLDWPEPVMQQSDRFGIYAEAASRLRDNGLLYPCFCVPLQIPAAVTGTDPDGAPLYPGTGRHMSDAERVERLERGDPVQFRRDSEAAILRAGMLTYTVVGPTVTDRPQVRYARP